MAITVQDISELTPEQVQQKLELVKQLMQEEHPELDPRRGVFADLVLLPSSQHAAALGEEVDRYRRSSSIKEISEDPALADDDIVDATISNYLIERQVGTAAVGEVTIIVSALASTTVARGAVFTASGKTFTSDAAYTAKTSASNVITDTDRALNPRGDGTYEFTINVTASEVGSDSQLIKDTVLVPSSAINNFVKAVATNDFTSGTDTETNAQLVDKVALGLSAKALSGPSNMQSLLSENFPNVLASSVIGFGDPEMFRDQHTVLPVSLGGRADWYVRSQALPQKLGLTKTATLVQKTSDGYGVWQFSLTRDEAPGFYDVFQIKLPSQEVTGSFDITSEIRTIDTTPLLGELTPDIAALSEGTFSRYQAAVVKFKDDQTATASLTVGTSTQDYAVTVRAMEKIDEIQTMAGEIGTRNYGGDVLVRAAVPCFVSLAFTLEGQQGVALPAAATLQNALASYVNNLGFNGRLHASALQDIIHNYLTGKVAVSAIDMNGEILRPEGSLRRIRSSETLIIPEEPEKMLTSRTVVFILDPADVLVSAQTVNIPQV
jgi:hypothetical protein